MKHIHSYIKIQNYFGWICLECKKKKSVFDLYQEASKEGAKDFRLQDII